MGIQVHREWKTNEWECTAERVRESGEGSVHVHGTRRTGLLGVMGGYTCVVSIVIVMEGGEVQWVRTVERWHDGGASCRQ